MIETMGDMPIKKENTRLHHRTSEYYVNEDGSVTKIRKTLVNDKVISASKTKKYIPTNKERKSRNCNSCFKSQSKLYLSLHIVPLLHVIFPIVLFVFMVINTTDTFGNYCYGFVGLFFFSFVIYYFITRPIINWIEDFFL